MSLLMIRMDIFHDGHNIAEYSDERSCNTYSNAEILVKENNILSNYDIGFDEIGTSYNGCSVDYHDCKERQKFKIVTWSENKATIDIK